MNKIIQIAVLGLFAASVVHAEPSSYVAWTPDKLNFIKQANGIKGKELAKQCAACHGDNGEGERMDIPALAGQQAQYLTATLTAYKNGERRSDIYSRMRVISQQLSDTEIQQLAKYYQQLQ